MAEESPPEDDRHEDISSETDLTWGTDSYSISKVLRKYQLPLLVTLAEGDMQTISVNEVIKIESILAVDYVEASVVEGCKNGFRENLDERPVPSSFPSTIALPKTLTSISLEVVKGQTDQDSNRTLNRSKNENKKSSLWWPSRLSKKPKMKFTSVRSLSKHRPKVVRVIKIPLQLVASPDLDVGNELLILDVIECQRLAVKYLRCRLRENNEPQKIIKLNLKWNGIYETIPEPQSMHVKDLTSLHGLPTTVRIRETSPTRGKWMNPKATSLIKQIRTLDLHLKLGQEATAYFAIGILGGGDRNKRSVVIISTNSDVLLKVSPEMEEKTERYQKLMTSYTGGDVELIPPEIFIRELKSSIFVTVPLWELQSWNVKLRNKKAPFSRRSLTSVCINGPSNIENHSYINVDSTKTFQHPRPPKEDGKEITTTSEKPRGTKPADSKKLQTRNCYADEPLPVFNNILDSDKSKDKKEDDDCDQTSRSSTCVTSHSQSNMYNSIPDTDDTKTIVKKQTGSARDSMPRSIPPPVPYRRRKNKSSKASWLSSFRRNPQAENRPLPDVPKDTTPIMSPSGQPSGQTSGIYITPTSSARVNADVVRSGHHKSRSSSSSSKKKTRRKSANDMMSSSSRDHSPSGSGLSLDCAIDVNGPPLPPRTPSLEKLDKHRSKSGKHSKEYRDPLSPKSHKDRLVSFEGDSDVGATSGKHRSKVRRHHSSSKHKHGEKKMKQGRKMSAPSIMEQSDSGSQQIADHSFEEATDYLIPNSTREDSSKDDTDNALSLTSSVTSPLTSPTVLTFTSPLKPCRKSNTSSYTSTKRVRLPERTFNSPAELPRDMSELTCGELGQALRLLHMREETVERFAKHLVNGALLEKMDADILKAEFELTHFELFKIRQFVSGWRP